MVILQILAFVAGVTLIVITIASAVRTFLVPRALQTTLARTVFIGVRRLFRLRARPSVEYEHRDRIMAFYAPVALLALLLVWIVIVLAGYTLLFWAVADVSLHGAALLAGSSMFTLGFASPDESLVTALWAFSAAGVGLVLLALFITYLPSLYGAFARREQGVSKLEVRAGQPPTGVYLLELSWSVGHMENLRELWMEWEDWFTDVDESHSSFPSLSFFRSTHSNQSWITAAGAVLDGASLFVSSVDVPRHPEPDFMIRSGYLCLRHLADFFLIPVDHDPRPDDPISIAREEFDVAYDRLAQIGIPLHPDRDRCWRDFAGWRVNYDAALIGLARLCMAPQAPWSSDRYEDGHYVPPVFPQRRRGAEA